jgi:spore maturation protein CgeB
MSQWQRIHIFDELSHYDYNIDVFNPLDYESSDESNEMLIKLIQRSTVKYDIFMTCVGSDSIYCETIDKIKELGLPTLLICFDNLHVPHMHKKIAPKFDLVWLTSFETKLMFEKWGCRNIIVQPYAANPFQFKPNWKKTISSVSFIGTPYGGRINKLNLLTNSNIQCTVYSDNFDINTNGSNFKFIHYNDLITNTINSLKFNIGRKVLIAMLINKIFYNYSVLDLNSNLILKPSVSFDEMQYLYSNYALSLNITELRNTYILKNPIHKLHLRTFEIPMCGGIEIASYTDELSDYFEDGKEIVLYKSEEELISKTKFYLDIRNKDICSKIRENARKRAESEHTWMCRFKVLESLV